MNRAVTILVFLTTLIGFNAFMPAWGESTHQHGVAHVNIGILKEVLVIELETPADNVLGFEHEPKTEQQKEHLRDSLSLLRQANVLFDIPSTAACKIQHVEIENPFTADEHEKHDDAHEEHEVHSDFTITYTYACQQLNQLKHINMASLFKHFPNFETLEVQWVNDKRQSATTVTRKAHKVNLDE